MMSRQHVLSLFAWVALAGCGSARASSTPSDSTKAAPGAGGTVATIPRGAMGGQTDGEWVMPGRDLSNTRYSPLADINVRNVGALRVTTTMSTGVLHGHEGQPLVVGGTMYVVTPWPNFLYAIDLSKPGGAVKWTYAPPTDSRAVGIACCDIVNRGAVYANGKIIYNTLDAQTVAVDAASGKEAWRVRVGDIAVGETITMAPIVVHDKVIVGNSGAELGVRGYVVALDVGSGKQVWKAYSTGPDADVLIGADFKPFYPKDRGTDLGAKTWPGDQWKLGGGTVWGWISYDPELNLLYYSTANPGVWNPDLREGDNKWSITLFAGDPDNGHAKWAYQFVKHDAWDYDEIMENVLREERLVATGLATDERQTLVTSVWNAEPRLAYKMPGDTIAPLVMAIVIGAMLIAGIFTAWAYPVGVVAIAIPFYMWAWPRQAPPRRTEVRAARRRPVEPLEAGT